MSPSRRIPTFLHDNGLVLACFGLFAVFFVGMVVSGAATYNQEQQEHGSHDQVSVLTYLTTGDFVEATFENWESEFLQMGMYVVLTAFLFQKGSSESKPINQPAPQDQDPREVGTNQWTPWPVQFWFESMQNWQSEFIAVAAIVGLSIFLRQRGSAESKPVAEPHRHTSA